MNSSEPGEERPGQATTSLSEPEKAQESGVELVYWPMVPSSGEIWVGFGCIVVTLIGSVCFFSFLTGALSGSPMSFFAGGVPVLALFLALAVLIGLASHRHARERRAETMAQRQETMDRTGSLLMSRADYLTGHPLIPRRETVVLGLTESALVIYALNLQQLIEPMTTIPLQDIIRVGTESPDSAHTLPLDVEETLPEVEDHSPYLNLTFRFQGRTHRMFLKAFETDPPAVWCRRIADLKASEATTGLKSPRRS